VGRKKKRKRFTSRNSIWKRNVALAYNTQIMAIALNPILKQ
jgi:hypothetical protein